MLVHLKKKTQIEVQDETKSRAKGKDYGKVQIRILLFDKALIAVLAEYSNYSKIFLAKNISQLSEHTKINDHATKQEKSK